jgi:hypothetical protein
MATEKKTIVNEKAAEDKVVQQKEAEKEFEKVMDTVAAGKVKTMSIKLPEDVHRKLKSKCALDGESTGNVMKKLINEYIAG